MRLYKVSRDVEDGAEAYDANLAHVICAESETDARRQAANAARDEKAAIWFEESTAVELLATARKHVGRGIILSEGSGL